MSRRSDTLYWKDMISAIEKIDGYVGRMSYEEFRRDSRTVDAVIRNLTVLGEAAAKISSDARAARPDIPWREIIGMRNKVIHEYFGVDEEILWQTIQGDLKMLRSLLQS